MPACQIKMTRQMVRFLEGSLTESFSDRTAYFTTRPYFWKSSNSSESTVNTTGLRYFNFHAPFDTQKAVNVVSGNLMEHLSNNYKKPSRFTELKTHSAAQDTHPTSKIHTQQPEEKFVDNNNEVCQYDMLGKGWCGAWSNDWNKIKSQSLDGRGLSGKGSPDPEHGHWNDFTQNLNGNCVSIAVIKAAMDKFGSKMYISKQPDGNNGFDLSPRDGEYFANVAHYLVLKANGITVKEASTADAAIKTGADSKLPLKSGTYHALAIDVTSLTITSPPAALLSS